MLLKVKQLFWLIFILIDLCVLGAALGGVYYLESDAPRQTLEQLLSEKIGRRVVFEANLDFNFFPWLGLDTGPVRVQSAPGSDYENQLVLNNVDFKVRLMSLLRGDLEVDTVIIDSPVLRLDRGRDGKLDLPFVEDRERDASEEPVEMIFRSMSVSGISVVNATCIYNDEETGNAFNVSGVNVRTGLVRRGVPLAFDVRADLDTDLLDIRAAAQVKGLMDFSWRNRTVALSDTTLSLSAASDRLLQDGEDLQAVATLDFNLVQGLIDVRGLVVQTAGVRLSGSARCENIYHAPDFRGSLSSTSFNPRDVLSRIDPAAVPSGMKSILNSASFSVDFHSTLDKTALSNMILHVDETTVKGNFSVQDYSRPWVEFDVRADKVNLDPYAGFFRSVNGSTATDEAGKMPEASAAEQEADLRDTVIADLVRRIPCRGRVDIGRLICGGMNLEDTRLAVSPGPQVATLSIGRGAYLDGDFSLSAGLCFDEKREKDTLYLSGKGEISPFSLTGIPLKTDFIKFRSGRARLQLHSLSSKGRTPGELFRNLKADLNLRAAGVAARLADKDIPVAYRDFHAEVLDLGLKAEPLAEKAPQGLIGRRLKLDLKTDFLKPDLRVTGSFAGSLFCSRRYPDRVMLRDSALDLSVDGSGLPVVKRGFELSLAGAGSLMDRSLELDKFSLKSGKIKISGGLQAEGLATDTAAGNGTLRLDKTDCAEIFSLFGVEKPETRDPTAFKTCELDTSFQLNGENLNLQVSRCSLDNATAEGTFQLLDFSRPVLNFTAYGHNVDVDRFLPPAEERPAVNATEALEVRLPEWRFPDGLLGAINASGSVECDYFRIFDFGGSRVSADVDMQNSVIDIRNIKADFHRGNLAGKLALGLRNGTVSLDTDFEGRGFDAGLFFVDYVGRDCVNGKTDASLKIKGHSSANTWFTDTMTGSLVFRIIDGSYLFASTAALEKKDNKEVTPTAFSLMRGAIEGRNGTFRVDDYQLKTNYLTATATGGFSFPADSINLRVDANIIKLPNLYLKIVNALLDALTGVNVTVTGKLSDPKVQVKGLERWSDVLNDVLGLPKQSFMFFRDLIF